MYHKGEMHHQTLQIPSAGWTNRFHEDLWIIKTHSVCTSQMLDLLIRV